MIVTIKSSYFPGGKLENVYPWCQVVAEAGFMAWLVKKIKVKVPFDGNKLYASEILSILLQNEPENRFGSRVQIVGRWIPTSTYA